MPDPQVVTTPAQPAASPATAVPPALPAAPTEQPKPSTSKNLFPDFYDKDGKLMGRPDPNYGQTPPASASAPAPAPSPAAPVVPAPVPASPASSPAAPPTPPPSTPPVDYLDLAQASNKKVKVKVNGVEIETTVDELVKNHQLNVHLTQKAQKVAEKEREVKKLLDDITSTPTLPTGEDDPLPVAQGKPTKKAGESDAQFEQRLQRIEAGLAQVSEATRGQRVESAIKALGNQIAVETGQTDFAEYVPEIQRWVSEHVADMRNPTPQELYYDTPEFYRSKFLELKLKKLSAAQSAPAAPAPTVPEPSRPVVTGIEPGGAAPSGAGATDDWQARYDAAYERAVKSGDMRDWAEISRLKYEAGRS